jgi:hypothetical protein
MTATIATQDYAGMKTDARRALALLIGINLCCYLDRYILASIIPAIKAEFLVGDPDANSKAGLLTTAFLIMVTHERCGELTG